MNSKKEQFRYPCHLWEIEDAKEAFGMVKGSCAREYGSVCGLEDGTVLHLNYPGWHDEGERFLTRCNACGGLVLVQHSMQDASLMFFDESNEYYWDLIPVATPEEADLLNILWDGEDLNQCSVRHLQREDGRYYWKEGTEPVPYDPEELKEKIRQKYSGLKPEQKEMLEDLIRKAGKPAARD